MMTTDKMVKRVAKTLVKEFKAGNGNTIPIARSLEQWTINGEDKVYFRYGHEKEELCFGNLDAVSLAGLTCIIATEVERILRLPKKTLVFKDTETKTRWGTWCSHDYTLVKKFVIVTPCKQFVAINNKLRRLNLPTIKFQDWYIADVAGKRSQIFSMDKRYYCTDERKCGEVLSYLKGKKKLSYDMKKVEDCEDREYGIQYETEWYGRIANRIQFKNHAGMTAVF